ncbi:MAG TPA: valine--tRNA ligase [Gaiellaceae bacterium]|nr:valine--tRNA ligase [Gaiellaceae bacterium]
MDPLYRPQGVEERWQRTWEEEGLYSADPDPTRRTFVDAHPPPNVTGELHMGHALQLALGDALCRLKRMQGFNVLFQPGYDHAGISTQNAVEKQLASEGKTREDLGREAFEARVWEWLREYGGVIMTQFRRIGASLDYRRERFTMDEGYVRAVLHTFVHLYRKGWIYRANRIINWCPFHRTSLSDLELVHVESDDALTTIRYPLADGSGHVAIATARPATIPADVAVAVHPDDDRYRDLVGREVVVPFVGRRVPVIADERVDPEFGTGALKVTPGHDPLDFEIGRAHGLPEPTAIAPDGRMNELVPELEGLTQEEADERILAWCRERGFIERREAYRHSIALCERCESRIEPLISPQWWCAMDELKQPALEALRARRVRYHPESQHRFAIDSLENAPDWCISRQLWWGHQLPVWECPDGHVTVAETEPDACAHCGSSELTRSEDVLDTWFSSALWPFATLGWPEETDDLRAFYPGDLQTTAREIIRLWENRMIFMGCELLGEAPFADVIIHSTVLAPDGRRMSKSLGTGIDPLDVIAEYGADATRYGLLKMSSTQDVRFSYGAVEEGRKLANKLWNASRLLLRTAGGEVSPALRPRSVEERWILARLDRTIAEVRDHLESFRFAQAVNALYHVTFDDFCDWYAEAIKPRLHERDADAAATALAALERLLAVLHPVIPHVTEEIWSQLPDRESRLIVSRWPTPTGDFADADRALERVQDAAAIYRRSGVRVTLERDERRIFEAVVRPVDGDGGGDGPAAAAEIERLRNEVARAERMLANERFVENAPPEVVAGEREKLARYRRELDALQR